MHMPQEIIDVDAFEEPEVQVIGQYRRKHVLRAPVPLKKLEEPSVVDLTHSDEDEVKPAAGPSRPPPARSDADDLERVTRGAKAALRRAQAHFALKKEGSVARTTIEVPVPGLPEPSESDGSESDVLGDVLDIDYDDNWLHAPTEKIYPDTYGDDGAKAITLQFDKSLVLDSAEVRSASTSQSTRRCHTMKKMVSDRIYRRLRRGYVADLMNLSAQTRNHIHRSALFTFPLRQSKFPCLTSGAVNMITQSNGLVAFGSCVVGGHRDMDAREFPYNIEGSLKMLCGETSISLDGHRMDLGPTDQPKYFTVNDVQFDPLGSTQLVSCGHDGKVVVWDCSNMAAMHAQPILRDVLQYGEAVIPSGVQFKPEGSRFAVWTSDGSIYIHDVAQELSCQDKFPSPTSKSRQQAQSVAWGHGSTSHILFATYAPETDKPKGYHRAYDVNSMKVVRKYQEIRPGECLDVDHTGTHLALVTRKGDNFRMSLYDIGEETQPAASIKLPIRSTHDGFCIQQVLFSPDSILLAVATSDNVTHVYDSRFLRCGALYEFPHVYGTEGTADDTKYGVPKVEWLQDPVLGLGLLSGGVDGTMRLWDVKHGHDPHADNVITQLPSYISWFHLGDKSKGEKALVVGDGSGNVIIQD